MVGNKSDIIVYYFICATIDILNPVSSLPLCSSYIPKLHFEIIHLKTNYVKITLFTRPLETGVQIDAELWTMVGPQNL